MPALIAAASDDAVHGPSVDGGVFVGEEPALSPDVIGVGSGPVGEELDEVGVQGDEPVVAEFAGRHSETVGVADLGDGIGGDFAEFCGAQAGARSTPGAAMPSRGSPVATARIGCSTGSQFSTHSATPPSASTRAMQSRGCSRSPARCERTSIFRS